MTHVEFDNARARKEKKMNKPTSFKCLRSYVPQDAFITFFVILFISWGKLF
jgi:hypothetical protein